MLPSACSFIVDVRLVVAGKTDRQQEKASRQKHAHKNQKTNEKTRQKNTNENVHSVTTCKKGQQKQRSRFLQEYKSKTSHTREDGHVGRNM
jgi:hypothetical protein